MVSVVRPLIAAAFSGLIGAWVMPADAAKRQPAPEPVVERSASGTIIQPTTTIVPDGTGHSRAIVIPRRRSYLDTGKPFDFSKYRRPQTLRRAAESEDDQCLLKISASC
jgi:hypothetical protein